MRHLFLNAFVSLIVCVDAFAASQSYNPTFIATWTGNAPTHQLCSGNGSRKNKPISLTLLQPEMNPGQNYMVILKVDWGCFAPMEIPGFIFDDEFWAAANDRMTFVKLKLEKNKTVSGMFRFDLNGTPLKMDFKNLKATKKSADSNVTTQVYSKRDIEPSLSSNLLPDYPPKSIATYDAQNNLVQIAAHGIASSKKIVAGLPSRQLPYECFKVGNAFGSVFYAMQMKDLNWKEIESGVNKNLTASKIAVVSNYGEIVSLLSEGAARCNE